MAVGTFLQIGDVLVVDPEHPLAQGFVGVVEQRQHRVREGELRVDAVLFELADSGLDVVRGGAGQIVVLHEHATEVAAGPGLALHPDHVRAVLVPDARRRALELLGEAFVEDVVGDRDVVVRGEDLGALRKPGEAVRRGVSLPVLGCAETLGGIETLSETALLGLTSLVLQSGGGLRLFGDYQVTGSS